MERWFVFALSASIGCAGAEWSQPADSGASSDAATSADSFVIAFARDAGSESAVDGLADAADTGLPPGAAVQISAGYMHTCARTVDGRVRCWGVDCGGELGPGPSTKFGDCTAALEPNPPIDELPPSRQVFAGHYFSCAVGTDDRLRCWGHGRYGLLADGVLPYTLVVKPHPELVPGVSGVDLVAGGGDYIAVLGFDRVLRSWGFNHYGELGYTSSTPCGNGDELPCSATPTVVPISGFTQLSWGHSHGCVIDHAGALSCWGENFYGQLGDGTTESRAESRPVSGLAPVAEVSAGFHTTVARTTDGVVHWWGMTAAHPFGKPSVTPVSVKGFAAPVTRVVAGSGFACAVLATRQVQCWGDNRVGTLGAVTPTNWTDKPVFVTGLERVVDLALGSYHACAVLDDGSIRCWGERPVGDASWAFDFEPREPIW